MMATKVALKLGYNQKKGKWGYTDTHKDISQAYRTIVTNTTSAAEFLRATRAATTGTLFLKLDVEGSTPLQNVLLLPSHRFHHRRAEPPTNTYVPSTSHTRSTDLEYRPTSYAPSTCTGAEYGLLRSLIVDGALCRPNGVDILAAE